MKKVYLPLDKISHLQKFDQEKMAFFISHFPQELSRAHQLAKKITLPLSYKKTKKIIVSGMGGSAIAADLIKNLFKEKIKIPFFINRDYQLPSFVDKDTFLIMISYSGETKEVLNCFNQGLRKKAKIFVISSNGKLLKKAKEKKLPYYTINFSAPPRVAFPYLFSSLLVVLEKLNFLKKDIFKKAIIKELISFNKNLQPKIRQKENLAKKIAWQSFEYVPLILGAEHLIGVAQRWKTQFNENAKNLAFFEILPEANHNFIEGLKYPLVNESLFNFIILDSPFYSSKIKKAISFYKEIFKKNNLIYQVVKGIKKDKISQALSLIILGDWASYYLAILNEINPTPVKMIKLLKSRL